KEAFNEFFADDDTPAREAETRPNTPVSGADLFDDFEEASQVQLTPEEQASIDAMNQGLFASIPYDRNNAEQNTYVDNFSKGIGKYRKKNPGVDFDGFIASLRSSFSSRKVEQNFNLIRAAWEKAGNEKISEKEAQKVYDDNFADATGI